MTTDRKLFEQLNKILDAETVIVGIGNILKGDDGVGPLVCQKLQQANLSVELIDAGTVPENYIQKIIKLMPKTLLIIDAIDFGAESGIIKIFTPQQISSHVISTHTLSPRLFVDVIQQNINVEVYFAGIQPEHTQLGQSVSTAVNKAIERLSDILRDIFLT